MWSKSISNTADQEQVAKKEKDFMEASEAMEDAEKQPIALIIQEREKNAEAT